MNYKRKWRLRMAARVILVCLLTFGAVCLVTITATNAEADQTVLFDVPLSDELQFHIANLCEEYHIDPAVVVGVIERESTFDASAVGDNGNSLGLMQIQPRWHKERMERLGCDDLLDSVQNVTVGVDILAELIVEYGDVERALMVYNAGAAGAYNGWFQYGIYSNEYSTAVLANAAALTPKETGGEDVNIPDNYDVWLTHEERQERQIEQLPVCVHCEQAIQQETAVCLDGLYYCDECLDLNRVEVVVE